MALCRRALSGGAPTERGGYSKLLGRHQPALKLRLGRRRSSLHYLELWLPHPSGRGFKNIFSVTMISIFRST